MTRTRALLVALVGIAPLPALAVASAPQHRAGLRITVKPRSGYPTTRFVVSFRTPERTGLIGGIERRDELVAYGPLRRAGCFSSVSRDLRAASPHAPEVISLDPGQLGGRWCVGWYHGQIDETEGVACFKEPCPLSPDLIQTLGTFTFRVRRSASHDTTPPTFAGLQSAFACTPGPQRPGETTPFALTWKAATDDVTPSSQIVYDVFMATTPGGEDFSHPDWTTRPGATQFRTPGLPSHGTFYFVVRARDRADNEDHNRVERRGIDPCV